MNMKVEQLARADLWVDDSFLAQGLRFVLEKAHFDSRIRYVFFTIEHYDAVLAQNYDCQTHCLILLTPGHMFHFLTDLSLYRLNTRATLGEMEALMAQAALRKGKSADLRQPKVKLSDRERRLLLLLREGKKVAEIADQFNLHFKTVYQTRQKLIVKLGCTGLIDFLRTLRTDVFIRWLGIA